MTNHRLPPFSVADADVKHERIPIDHPVKTAFGVMQERHAVLLLLEDGSGQVGVGESWVNFPLWAAWERVALFTHGFIPYLWGSHVDSIPEYIGKMYEDFVGPARQSGTIGPLVQALCAVELALWDLQAQRAGVPLAHCLFAQPASSVRVYASGINSPIPWNLIDEHLDRGITLFKLKLGFGDDEDRRNLEELSHHLDARASLAVDVNCGWSMQQAERWLPDLEGYNVQWIEEPLKASEEMHLAELRAISNTPLAGGENLPMPPGVDVQGILNAPFDVLQPDLTKNAPLHVARELVQAAEATEKQIVPHFLGSAPGQAASLQFAAGCPEALVELDINRNPLRTEICDQPFEVVDGRISIPDEPGIGWRLSQ